jgi:hypothetical protein
MTQPLLIACKDHGGEFHCYIQRDGTHIPDISCTCQLYPKASYSAECPVDLHREAADAKNRTEVKRPKNGTMERV